MIPIYKPYLPKSSLAYAHEALDSTWISSQGKYIQLAQEALQELLNAPYVILLNNGTSACHLVAKCLATKQNKNEIIVPNNVYVAAWNAFLFDRDYKIFTVDADLNTWNYNLDELDKSIIAHPNAAVLIVHNIGNIINVPKLKRKYPNTLFVEDNCEGFLGTYENVFTGTASYASSISFFGNKNITSGEGGAFITNDEDVCLFAKCVQGQGQSAKRFIHDELGYNYRMTNIQAAILYGQLEILPTILDLKHKIFDRYRTEFQDRSDIFIQKNADNTKNANWHFGVRVPGQTSYEVAESFFKQRSIEIRPMFYPMHAHKYISDMDCIQQEDSTNAVLLNKECFLLPSYPELKSDEQDYILKSVNDYLNSGKR
jgi:perosamine synthetase